MTILSGHISTLYIKLAHLGKQVQIHCLYPHPQLDVIQLNAPDYDPDIDRELDSATDVQPPNAQSNKEDTSTGTPKAEDHTTIAPITNRLKHHPSDVLPDLTALNTTTSNNNEQNIPAITAPYTKTSQN